ncbi:MAG TPA: 1-deoxy-D-xylulose-5-phosphate reductoisomerase [Chloroflexota bacterium]|nr:1-deoxy-D-xylulose-5-phosphate reductoisomerase [Chloroflexota bacterium]
MSTPKRLAVLGSTGSIGTQALDVVEWHPDRFQVVGLAARSDSALFRQQVARFKPRLVALTGGGEATWRPNGARVWTGPQGLVEVATAPDVDLVLVATSGTAGLAPTIAALRAGRPVALANKEALIMAGHLVMRAACEGGGPVIPVDSEHSAIWQCLNGEDTGSVRRVTLTASGGAFRDLPLHKLAEVTPQQAVQHPNWSMGAKITVDSATLMNKGLEVIEAHWLFDLPLERIGIVLHRESIVHSLVEFVDGSVKAQLSIPDMRLPIQYALSYPDRLAAPSQPLDLSRIGGLTFSTVDPARFRCAFLAIEAGRRGGSYPAALNAANETAVELFLNGLIRFDQIPEMVEAVLERHVQIRDPDLEVVGEVDRWAREVCHALAPALVST